MTDHKDLATRFEAVRTYSEKLCKPLEIEDYTPQSAVFASPPKWHLAHTTWFYEEFILKPHCPDYKLFDDQFSFLFNSYYNAIGDRISRQSRGLLSRPSVEKVYEYRQYVTDKVLESPQLFEDPDKASLIELGINHEEQHQELLITDLKYTLSKNPLYPVYKDNFSLVEQPETADGWLTMQEGLYKIGFEKPGFCYDNELDRHQVYLQDYLISKKLVTVREYLEFMEDGGYSRFDLWLDEGWAWVQQNNVNAPLYWYRKGENWLNYTLSGLVPVVESAPMAHVNFYEASAYATWAGKRLPTEFEWEAAAGKLQWGTRWEWTNSAYLPYPGFQQADGAIGEYNGKFMINQMVLRGASLATSEGHSRVSYRNFFQPEHRWQLTGIRLAQ